MNSIILVAGTRLLVALFLVFSVFMLLRGHNEPGGGFIGGLVAVSGSSMLASVLGVQAAQRWQPLAPMTLAMVGVGLAMMSGLASAELPFLTHRWTNSGLSTVILFDLGVFCSVWGGLTGYIYALLDDADGEITP